MTAKEAIIVVDDDHAVRDSLQSLLETAGFPVRLYGSAAAFLADCPAGEQGCLLLDVQMPDMDGLTLQQMVRTGWPRLAVVVMTGHGDVPIAVRAMKAGAVDFIEKPFHHEVLLEVIRHAIEHSRQVAKEVAETDELATKLRLLSKREREVLDGLVAGLPNKTIAYDLGVSPRTIEIYRARLMDKMQARTLSELVRLATTAGVRPK
jgi:two-component system, LuxR family, response regulator FixJ